MNNNQMTATEAERCVAKFKEEHEPKLKAIANQIRTAFVVPILEKAVAAMRQNSASAAINTAQESR